MSKQRSVKVSSYQGLLDLLIRRFNGRVVSPDIERTAKIMWMQAKSKAQFRSEPLLVDILGCKIEIDSFSESINIEEECSKALADSAAFLNNAKNIRLNDNQIGWVFKHMDRKLRLARRKLKPMTYSNAFNMSTKNTSSSFPRYRTPKGPYFGESWKKLDTMMSKNDYSDFHNSFITVSWRVQINRKGKLKFRLFYPVPQLVQAAELRLMGEFFTHFNLCKDTPYVFANTHGDLAKRWISLQDAQRILCADFTAFDQSIPNSLLDLQFRYIRSHLILSKEEDQLFYEILHYHKTALIFMAIRGTPHFFRKQRGLLSGSVLTNLLGTFCNMFVLNDSSININGAVLKHEHYHGDDNMLGISKDSELARFSEFISSTFGMTLDSGEKSEVYSPGVNIYFLGHYFNDTERLLNRDRLNKQLCISQNFIPETVMTESMRVFSKVVSLLSKCSDGKEYFDSISAKLKNVLKMDDLPTTYVQLFSAGNDYTIQSMDGIWEGWRKQ